MSSLFEGYFAPLLPRLSNAGNTFRPTPILFLSSDSEPSFLAVARAPGFFFFLYNMSTYSSLHYLCVGMPSYGIRALLVGAGPKISFAGLPMALSLTANVAAVDVPHRPLLSHSRRKPPHTRATLSKRVQKRAVLQCTARARGGAGGTPAVEHIPTPVLGARDLYRP